MDLRLSENLDEISWEELAQLYTLAPLGKPRDPKQLERAFRNSSLTVFAFDGPILIGAGRALSDGVWRAAIYDVAILPDYQGQGIGSEIMRHLVDAAHVDVITLYAAPGKTKFYERFGFQPQATAMAIFPDPEEARSRGLLLDSSPPASPPPQPYWERLDCWVDGGIHIKAITSYGDPIELNPEQAKEFMQKLGQAIEEAE